MFSVLLSAALLGASILLHELGHYVAAKRRGLFVPRFSIGFGPRLCSWHFRGTEFCLSLLPLGGYVALPQLMELRALEGIYSVPEGYRRSLSARDKIVVALMGPLFNVLLAFFIASVLWIRGMPGPSEEHSTAVGYIFPELPTASGSVANPNLHAGLHLGDVILAVDGHPVRCFGDIRQAVGLGSGRDEQGQATVELQVRRGEAIHSLTLHPLPVLLSGSASENFRSLGIAPASSLTISRILPQSPAAQAGLRVGDQLLSVDGQTLHSLPQLQAHLQEDRPGVQLGLRRDGKEIPLPVRVAEVPVTRAYWKFENRAGQELFCLIPQAPPSRPQSATGLRLEVGFSGGTRSGSSSSLSTGDTLLLPHGLELSSRREIDAWFSQMRKKSLFFQKPDGGICEYPLGDCDVRSVPATTVRRLGIACASGSVWTHVPPWRQMWHYTVQSYRTLRGLLSPHSDIAARHLMGPPGIFRTMQQLAAHHFWNLLAFLVMLNVNLAFLNLLPLPVLDGGHLLLAGLQVLCGQHLPLRWWYRGQALFVLLLLGLMAYVSFHDLRRWADDRRQQNRQRFREQICLPS